VIFYGVREAVISGQFRDKRAEVGYVKEKKWFGTSISIYFDSPPFVLLFCAVGP